MRCFHPPGHMHAGVLKKRRRVCVAFVVAWAFFCALVVLVVRWWDKGRRRRSGCGVRCSVQCGLVQNMRGRHVQQCVLAACPASIRMDGPPPRVGWGRFGGKRALCPSLLATLALVKMEWCCECTIAAASPPPPNTPPYGEQRTCFSRFPLRFPCPSCDWCRPGHFAVAIPYCILFLGTTSQPFSRKSRPRPL